jgi:hypothetical protein
MSRGLDHIVHAVHDLDGAAALYERLGFTVGARNQHAWGTHNRIIQLPGFFIELLTVAEPEKLSDEGFAKHFGRHNQSFLQRQEGLSILMLESRDAAADAESFRAAGIAASPVMHFERQGRRPDGSSVKVGFSLAFARDKDAADIAFAVCQQHHPENFWNPAFQNHANTAAGIAGVVLVAENPTDHHIFLSAFAGERELNATSSGIVLRTPRGEIQIMDPTAYRSHFGVDPPALLGGARLAAMRFAVRDFSAALNLMKAASVPGSVRMGRLIVGPQTAMGAALVFEAQ